MDKDILRVLIFNVIRVIVFTITICWIYADGEKSMSILLVFLTVSVWAITIVSERENEKGEQR